MERTILGFDLGNSRSKTKNTTIVSGYTGPFTVKPTMATHVVKYKEDNYALSDEPLQYQKDKTENERCLVLSLAGIASEIIFRAKSAGMQTSDDIQKYINNISAIGLGVGLPIAHYKTQYINNLVNYYMKYMGDGIEFDYDDYHFSFTVTCVRVYPQGGAAAVLSSNEIGKKYNSYYIIDIGGYTVDPVQIKDGVPSKIGAPIEMGILTLYDYIINYVYQNFDKNIDYNAIEDVINHKNSILSIDIQNTIHDCAKKHAFNLLNNLRQQHIMFDSRPCLFIGGGSIMLEQYIMKSTIIQKEAVQFLHDANINAKAYEVLLRNELRGE